MYWVDERILSSGCSLLLILRLLNLLQTYFSPMVRIIDCKKFIVHSSLEGSENVDNGARRILLRCQRKAPLHMGVYIIMHKVHIIDTWVHKPSVTKYTLYTCTKSNVIEAALPKLTKLWHIQYFLKSLRVITPHPMSLGEPSENEFSGEQGNHNTSYLYTRNSSKTQSENWALFSWNSNDPPIQTYTQCKSNSYQT